jgi:hypothetical protein
MPKKIKRKSHLMKFYGAIKDSISIVASNEVDLMRILILSIKAINQ